MSQKNVSESIAVKFNSKMLGVSFVFLKEYRLVWIINDCYYYLKRMPLSKYNWKSTQPFNSRYFSQKHTHKNTPPQKNMNISV